MRSNNKNITRRRFLKKSLTASLGAVAFPYIVPSAALGKAGNIAPSNRVTLGCIGVGSRGTHNMRSLMSFDGQVTAICDVNRNRRQAAKKEVEAYYAQKNQKADYKGCSDYDDFRTLIARDDIDAVMVATPDHWHVPIALTAVRAGKDIYVEKPLGMTIVQGQVLRDEVKRRGVIFQHGTEQRAMRHFRYVCELVRNGYLGELKKIKVGAPGGNQGAILKPQPVPEGLNYDMWLGPAPWRPYMANFCQSHGHWFIYDFAASGFIAGWGIHYMDIVQWALGADQSGPVEISGRAVFPRQGIYDTPISWNIDYLYSNGVRVDFTNDKQNPHGIVFEGTKGKIYINRSGIGRMEPRSLNRITLRPDEIHLFETNSDDRNFLEAVRARGETCSPIDAAHRSTSVCFLGNIACRLNRKLRWNPDTEKFVNDDQANRMLSASMRSPWHL